MDSYTQQDYRTFAEMLTLLIKPEGIVANSYPESLMYELAKAIEYSKLPLEQSTLTGLFDATIYIDDIADAIENLYNYYLENKSL